MKIVIAPDSFKDALPADQAAASIANGVRSVLPDAVIELCPIADGGEGFTRAITRSTSASVTSQRCETSDPLGRTIQAQWTLLEDANRERTAVIELAAASGIELLQPSERDVMRTTTFGTGKLIDNALGHTPKRILLGIGSSATNDGGCGIAQALGTKFFDRNERQMNHPITGADIPKIVRIDHDAIDQRMQRCQLQVACDVDNPLTGQRGAAKVYGPQKGASPEQVEELERGLRNLESLWLDQFGYDVKNLSGAGAAGGVGGGLVAMLGAQLMPGAGMVLDVMGFDQCLQGADLVITGEGKLDQQSLHGKAAMTVADHAAAVAVPCYALVGCAEQGIDQHLGDRIGGYRVIGVGLEPAASIARTAELLEKAAANLIKERVS